jgi:phosphohistidine phosphatase
MKTLYLIRHAKSSWKFPHLIDFQRPLNKRGLRDAPFMGLLLYENSIRPDIMVSSPAKRALHTAELISESLGYPLDHILTDEKIYDCSMHDLLNVVQHLPDRATDAAVFCHNPAVTDLANALTEKHLIKFPTCGIFCAAFEVTSWKHIEAGKGQFKFFFYPKQQKRF